MLTSMATIIQLRGGKLKVILETGALTEAQAIAACELCGQMGVDFVDTSTGFFSPGADTKVVGLLRKHLPKQVKIKASGNINDRATALSLMAAGADRIGSGESVKIITE